MQKLLKIIVLSHFCGYVDQLWIFFEGKNHGAESFFQRENHGAESFFNGKNHGAESFFKGKNHGAESFFEGKNHGALTFFSPPKIWLPGPGFNKFCSLPNALDSVSRFPFICSKYLILSFWYEQNLKSMENSLISSKILVLSKICLASGYVLGMKLHLRHITSGSFSNYARSTCWLPTYRVPPLVVS